MIVIDFCHLRNVVVILKLISEHMLQIKFMSISCETTPG